MVSIGKINLEELSEKWGFDPGQDTGTARIKARDLDVTFSYTAINPTGTQSWHFEGAPLDMTLRSDTLLAVSFTENGGALRTLLFAAMPTDVDDLIIQETARRRALFDAVFRNGPVYTSHNYGTLTFAETPEAPSAPASPPGGDGAFTWTGAGLLVPRVIPTTAIGSGAVSMRLFLSAALAERYDGAFTLYFNDVLGQKTPVNFMYTFDSGGDSPGFRLEYLPDTSLDGVTVSRRSPSPLVLYFYKAASPTVPEGGL